MISKNAIHTKTAYSVSDFIWLYKTVKKNKEFLTGESAKINTVKQIIFMYKIRNGILPFRIFIYCISNKRVGYGLIKPAGESIFITEVVDENFRGNGIGNFILRHLLSVSSKEYGEGRVVVHIRKNNLPSLKMHENAGFSQVSETDEIVEMELLRLDSHVNCNT